MFQHAFSLANQAGRSWNWSLSDLISILALAVSIIAVSIVIWDRRAHLILKERKGEWHGLKLNLNKTEVIFVGVIEIYNVSARANAIREYEFWEKRPGGKWEKMESQFYQETIQDEIQSQNNVTPLTLGPYSGIDANVMALTKMPQPYEMQVRIEVEDLFGKRYRVEVKAIS